MKVKKEIEVTVCDFCENDARGKCSICGKDICQDHDLTLHVNYRARGEGLTGYPTTQTVRHFCPDHLTEELKKTLVQSLTSTMNTPKTGLPGNRKPSKGNLTDQDFEGDGFVRRTGNLVGTDIRGLKPKVRNDD